MAYPNYPSSPSYSFTNSYKVHDGYRILHLPQLIYPTYQKTYTPNTIYLNTPTCGGSLILGESTQFVSNPSATQILNNGDTISTNSQTQRIENSAPVTGIRLQAGVYDGQHLIILMGEAPVQFDPDESVSNCAFCGASFTAGGQGFGPGRYYQFIWSATAGDGDGRWLRG